MRDTDVAPARERGLKFTGHKINRYATRRSREGAWIEICARLCGRKSACSRSREGAWIEIAHAHMDGVIIPCRSREGAWIEMAHLAVWLNGIMSLPRGSVD